MKTTALILAGLISATGIAFSKAPQKTAAKSGYIAHEWGTFTSVQGHDGVQLEWNPFVVSELPGFVYDTAKASVRAPGAAFPALAGLFAKNVFVTRQRMETPVIYFYSDQPRTVNVGVEFAEGRFTEWFPQAAEVPRFGPVKGAPRVMRGSMQWKNVQIMPGNGADELRFFPRDESGSHYYAARETDASGLRMKRADGTEEYEKFLFYRGVAQFEAPLKVTHYGEHAEKIGLQNVGTEKLGGLFVYAVRGEKAALVPVPSLAPKATADVDFKFDEIAQPAVEVRAKLSRDLWTHLVSAGLYEREASAMVKTWEDSWFGEQGTRVLYTLPQTWSDKVLPLKITPAPKELKRVFVGRAELITPAQEWALLKEVIRYAEGGSLERREAIGNVQQLGLGRFSDAAARRLTFGGPQVREFSQSLWSLLDAATRSALKSDATTSLK